jgi:quercetin dioxygenase-like cupin family protein
VEPVIRNFRNIYTPEGPGARLISLDDGPPTCTMSYSEIYPGKTSTHHIRPWEHEVYIIKGVGTLVCDGKEYPVKEGDAMFIPRSILCPLLRAVARATGGRGTGKPPVIRNYRDVSAETGSRILSTKDGVPNYVMLYNGDMTPGAVSHPESGGHAHPWEHTVYILEGYGTLFCDGKEYTVAEGDGVLVPPNSFHQWRNTSALPMKRVTFNPIAAEGQGG